jgi:hypothetical protein
VQKLRKETLPSSGYQSLEAIYRTTSSMLLHVNQTADCNIPEDGTFNTSSHHEYCMGFSAKVVVTHTWSGCTQREERISSCHWCICVSAHGSIRTGPHSTTSGFWNQSTKISITDMAGQYSQLRDSLIGIATKLRSAFSVKVSEQARDIFLITYSIIFLKHISYLLVLWFLY